VEKKQNTTESALWKDFYFHLEGIAAASHMLVSEMAAWD
jgi:hypothetical protein